jgi:hypothetical protein
MKRCVLLLFILSLAATPSWADKKLTVQQLKELLVSLQEQKKSDSDVANELKQVELTEQMDRTAMNDMAGAVPGTLSTEQIYVLEAKSATLPPPAADLPKNAAADAAAQTALLNKAFAYAKTYAGLPHLGVTKTTLRFQDNIDAIGASSGLAGGSKDASTTVATGMAGASNSYVRYINATETPIEIVNGAEKLPSAKDKTPWGQNGLISLKEPDPSLGMVLADAQGSGSLTFVRWENVNGRPAAVFGYTVDKKKSHLNINICCFPEVEQAGTVRFTSASVGGLSGGGGGASGNLQTNTQWHNYKATVPYHGMVFIDPDTGVVVRLITQADFKTSDYIHQQDTRIDYGPTQVGGQTHVLPMKVVVQSDTVPQGDSRVGGQSTRHTYFTSSYKDYVTK